MKLVDRAENGQLGEEQLGKLNHISARLCRMREEAINYRKRLNIETEWAEDEHFFEGEDGSLPNSEMRQKDIFEGNQEPRNTATMRRSTVSINVTRPYTETASARTSDLLVRNNERNWSIEPTPITYMEEIAAGDIPPEVEVQIRDDLEQNQDAYVDEEHMAEAIQSKRQQVIDETVAIREEARESARKAQKRIEDWLVASNYQAELRQVIDDAARLGTGVLRGPVPMQMQKVAVEGGKMRIVDDLRPTSSRVDPWNCFPDPDSRENPQKGSFHFEREVINQTDLRELLKDSRYYRQQIIKLLSEDPMQDDAMDKRDHLGVPNNERKGSYVRWYFYSRIELDVLESIGKEVTFDDESDAENSLIDIPMYGEMVNDKLIYLALNVLDSGAIPYDYFVWSQRAAVPWGRGIPRLIRNAQRIINGAVRNMMDNAGIAGGPMFMIDTRSVRPQNNSWRIEPYKVWEFTDDPENNDPRMGVVPIEIPMFQGELAAIADMAMTFSESTTGMPLLLQGQVSSGTPETVGGMKLLQENAASPLRRLAGTFDEKITKPHIQRYYEYLLQYGPDDSEKQEMEIVAKGSAALVEMDEQSISLRELMQYAQQPMYKIDPAKVMEKLVRSMRMRFEELTYSDEEWQGIVEQMLQPPPDPRLEIAQQRSQIDQQKLEQMSLDKSEERALRWDIEKLRRSEGADRNEIDRELRTMEAQIKQAELGGNLQINLNNIKAKLVELKAKAQTEANLKQLEVSSNANTRAIERENKLREMRS